MELEFWKDIKGYEGIYQVSNNGKVRRWARYLKSYKELSPYKTNGGYFRVSLCFKYERKLFLVHQLVAKSFVDNPKSLTEVNHIDGNKKNNFSYNLEWVSRSENIKHAILNGLKIGINKRDKKTGRILKGNQNE